VLVAADVRVRAVVVVDLCVRGFTAARLAVMVVVVDSRPTSGGTVGPGAAGRVAAVTGESVVGGAFVVGVGLVVGVVVVVGIAADGGMLGAA
jgi:hypothetical protein